MSSVRRVRTSRWWSRYVSDRCSRNWPMRSRPIVMQPRPPGDQLMKLRVGREHLLEFLAEQRHVERVEVGKQRLEGEGEPIAQFDASA